MEKSRSERQSISSAFLLAQLGSHAARLFGERLAELELSAPHVGMLRAIAQSGGISQQNLAQHLGIVPSRVVGLLDELEQRGVVERRAHASDRRQHALHITKKGTQVMGEVSRIARAHDQSVCAALSGAEREQLHALLTRIAEQQGLTPGVHPGFAKLGDGAKKTGKR